ncbi:hypothetical protein V8C44DRAFT_325511 [Trichoderma aethiopicum]
MALTDELVLGLFAMKLVCLHFRTPQQASRTSDCQIEKSISNPSKDNLAAIFKVGAASMDKAQGRRLLSNH